MTRMTGPDCAVMCNLINTHTHIVINTPTRHTICSSCLHTPGNQSINFFILLPALLVDRPLGHKITLLAVTIGLLIIFYLLSTRAVVLIKKKISLQIVLLFCAVLCCTVPTV